MGDRQGEGAGGAATATRVLPRAKEHSASHRDFALASVGGAMNSGDLRGVLDELKDELVHILREEMKQEKPFESWEFVSLLQSKIKEIDDAEREEALMALEEEQE